MEHDLIRRSKLLAKKCMVRGHLDTGSPCHSKVKAVPVDVIEREPAVDAVEVVRCKECKWSHTPYTDGFEKIFPGGAFSCRMGRGLNQDPFGERLPNDDSIVSGDDFCSYGERKEGFEDG